MALTRRPMSNVLEMGFELGASEPVPINKYCVTAFRESHTLSQPLLSFTEHDKLSQYQPSTTHTPAD